MKNGHMSSIGQPRCATWVCLRDKGFLFMISLCKLLEYSRALIRYHKQNEGRGYTRTSLTPSVCFACPFSSHFVHMRPCAVYDRICVPLCLQPKLNQKGRACWWIFHWLYIYIYIYLCFLGRSGRHGFSEWICEGVEAVRHSGLKISDGMSVGKP